MATKTAPQTVRFLTEKNELKLIRRSQKDIFLDGGRVAKDPSTPEISYTFDSGHGLELRAGQDVLRDKLDPETGELVEQDAIEWVRGTREYGVWVHEIEPTAPPESQILTAIALAAAAGDIDELVRLADEEAATWERESVLDVIRSSIENIQAPPGKE